MSTARETIATGIIVSRLRHGDNALVFRRAERQGPGADMTEWCCTALLGPRRWVLAAENNARTWQQGTLRSSDRCYASLDMDGARPRGTPEPNSARL